MATSASYAGGALTLYDGTTAVATLELSGDYAGETFNTTQVSIENGLVSGTQISVDPIPGYVPPAVQAPMDETVSSGVPFAISGVGITDPTSGASLSVTLSDGGGLLTVPQTLPAAAARSPGPAARCDDQRHVGANQRRSVRP